MDVSFSVTADKVTTEPTRSYGSPSMSLEVEGVNLKSLIESIGIDHILDQIGKDACVDHFNIEVQSDS